MQPRQRALVVVATVVVLAVLVLLASRVAGPEADRRPPERTAAPTPTPTPAALPAREVTRLLGRAADRQCSGPPVTTTPEVPDREDQLAVARAALELSEIRFDVVLAGPTQLGVVAVVDGDVESARAAMPDVPHVIALSLPLRALGDAVDDHEAQLAWVVSSLLAPTVREVEDAVAGVPGRQAVAAWPAGGAVVVQWAAPVPAVVRDLAGPRDDGAQVVVVPVPYSAADLRRAARGATRAVRTLGVAGPIRAVPCQDGSGIDLAVQSRRPAAEVRRTVRAAVDVPVNLVVYPPG